MIKVGIIGGGWPGSTHAKGYREAGGYKVVAVADLIPNRRKKLLAEAGGAAREHADAEALLKDADVEAVSICLPNHLHLPVAKAALKAGKHVVCEKPPALNAKEAKQLEAAAQKAGKVLLYSVQRRFGAAEQASSQAIAKGYIGEVYHARASWMRTRGIPLGTGWFTKKCESGGGALIDLGIHMLDVAWGLLGQPRPVSAYGVTHQRFTHTLPEGTTCDVDDAAFAIVRFEGGKSLELGTSWAINQAPHQQGAVCRVYGDAGAVEVYTPQGALLYRNFDAKGQAKATALKPPRVIHHAAMMRHFKDCITGKAQPLIGGREGVSLMQMVDAIYKSSETGKAVEIG